MHWYDRGFEGLRGRALAASAWHYRTMTSELSIVGTASLATADGTGVRSNSSSFFSSIILPSTCLNRTPRRT